MQDLRSPSARPLGFSNLLLFNQLGRAPIHYHSYNQITHFVRQIVQLSPTIDLSIGSIASDVLSIYVYGIARALVAQKELTADEGKRLAVELFESHFGWDKGESRRRVRALASSAKDGGSLFAPVIEAGGRAFLLWRKNQPIPNTVSFHQVCVDMHLLPPFLEASEEQVPGIISTVSGR